MNLGQTPCADFEAGDLPTQGNRKEELVPHLTATRRSRGLGIPFCLAIAVVGTIRPVRAQPDLPWLKYRSGIGCPSRSVLAEELMRRLSYQVPASKTTLSVHIEYVDGTYVGSVALGDTESTAPRQVKNGSCDQVVRALSLVGALLLEEGRRPKIEVAPAPKADETRTARPEGAQNTTTTPTTTTNPLPNAALQRPIRRFTVGPWFALTGDGIMMPSHMQLGGRIGALFTYHQRNFGFQEMLRLSLGRVSSGTLKDEYGRTADIAWTSLRLDACHGWKANQLSTVAGCALVDAGMYAGTGHSEGGRERSTLLGRAGVAVYARQALFAGLALHADLGVMLPFAHRSFVFEASNGFPAGSTIHRARSIGPVADLGLEVHFW
jgi:hypothetical protein